MRAAWIAAIAVARAASAHAEPRVEASGFVGYGSFGDSALGNSWAPEQVPTGAPVIGARVGWLAVPHLATRGWLALGLAVEGEVAFAAAFTGDPQFERMRYFAPVFGWRAHALLRQGGAPAGRRLGLHAVLGAGGATIASRSPFMTTETDPLAYAGLGAALAPSPRWEFRFDARQGVMPGRADSITRVTELQLGINARFGGGRPARRGRATVASAAVVAPAGAAGDGDGDGDGIADARDACPAEPEAVNGIDDTDGCPEPDPDADGVTGAADACPTAAEDIDGFEDTDGCPELDNDRDGLADGADTCPGEPEVRNGYRDADGCPDAVPDALTRALGAAAALRFEPGRARVTEAAKRALAPILAALEADPELALVIAGAPDPRERADRDGLARRRADAVTWYLVDQGIARDRLDTAITPTGRVPIGLALRVPRP